MNILKMNLWRGGLFKQIKFLIASPQSAQNCILISEAGIVSQELLPIHTGFVSADEAKKSWAVLHNLKRQVRKFNQPVQDDSVLVISERSYVPLDPFNSIKPKDKERLTSLKDIARLRHAEARADTGRAQNTHTRLSQMIINGGFVLLGIYAMVTLIKGCA